MSKVKAVQVIKIQKGVKMEQMFAFENTADAKYHITNTLATRYPNATFKTRTIEVAKSQVVATAIAEDKKTYHKITASLAEFDTSALKTTIEKDTLLGLHLDDVITNVRQIGKVEKVSVVPVEHEDGLSENVATVSVVLSDDQPTPYDKISTTLENMLLEGFDLSLVAELEDIEEEVIDDSEVLDEVVEVLPVKKSKADVTIEVAETESTEDIETVEEVIEESPIETVVESESTEVVETVEEVIEESPIETEVESESTEVIETVEEVIEESPIETVVETESTEDVVFSENELPTKEEIDFKDVAEIETLNIPNSESTEVVETVEEVIEESPIETEVESESTEVIETVEEVIEESPIETEVESEPTEVVETVEEVIEESPIETEVETESTEVVETVEEVIEESPIETEVESESTEEIIEADKDDEGYIWFTKDNQDYFVDLSEDTCYSYDESTGEGTPIKSDKNYSYNEDDNTITISDKNLADVKEEVTPVKEEKNSDDFWDIDDIEEL